MTTFVSGFLIVNAFVIVLILTNFFTLASDTVVFVESLLDEIVSL